MLIHLTINTIVRLEGWQWEAKWVPTMRACLSVTLKKRSAPTTPGLYPNFTNVTLTMWSELHSAVSLIWMNLSITSPTITQPCSSHLTSVNWNYLFSTSSWQLKTTHYIRPCTTRRQIRTTTSITRHSIRIIVKKAIPYSQFLRLRRICSVNDDFVARTSEMKTYFLTRGYPETSLDNDLHRVSTVPRDDALTPPSH